MIDRLALLENVVAAGGRHPRYRAVDDPVERIELVYAVFQKRASLGEGEVSPVGRNAGLRVRILPAIWIPVAPEEIAADELDGADLPGRHQFVHSGGSGNQPLLKADVQQLAGLSGSVNHA